jgi:hypothetical protein
VVKLLGALDGGLKIGVYGGLGLIEREVESKALLLVYKVWER